MTIAVKAVDLSLMMGMTTMKFSKLNALAAAACLALCAGSASAAIVTMNATANLALGYVASDQIRAGKYFGEADALPVVSPVTVATGDTFVLNLDFLGNQQLTVTGMSTAWPLVLTKDYAQGSSITMTGTLELLGSNGSVVASATKTDTNGAIHIAQVFSGVEFGNPASVTFSGLRYTGVVNAQGVNPRTYDAPSLWFAGRSVQIGEAAAEVPEPASLALMLLGLGAAGAVRRRRP
jgi:hypothetical protein